MSRKDGWFHLYKYNVSGELLQQITKGEWEITRVLGFDSKEKYVFDEATKEKSNGFHDNIEKASIKNTDYRRVVFTSKHLQLVYMSIEPGDEIGEEVHAVDQFIRSDGGEGKSIINGEERSFGNGDAIIVPSGSKHNVINTGKKPLKLYTVYTPPQHLKDTVQKTKADEVEDKFDGNTDV